LVSVGLRPGWSEKAAVSLLDHRIDDVLHHCQGCGSVRAAPEVVELVHLVVAADHLVADRRVAVCKGLQRPFQQQLGLGAGLLDLALKGAQLLMKAPPALAHQPNLPVLSAAIRGCPR
jgi:hypothetical protein